MRGAPLIPVFVLAIVLALAGIPVWVLTRREAPPVPARQAPAAQEEVMRMMTLLMTSTDAAELELQSGGKMIWQQSLPQGGEAFSHNIQAFGLSPGNDVVARVKWKNDTAPHAVRLRFVQDGETLADATIWGGLEAEDVITLKAP